MTNKRIIQLVQSRMAIVESRSVLHKSWVLVVIIAAFCLVSTRVTAATGPENTVLVVNASSPDSLAVANLYIEMRNIPATNVIYLDKVTISEKDPETSDSKRFQSEIINPVIKAIKERGLENQIDCIAYSAGFPTRFNFQPQLNKYLKQAGLKYDVHFHAPWGSITSLTYFHDNVFSDNPDFVRLDANWYSKPPIKDILSNPFTGEMATSFTSARDQLEKKNYADAIRLFSDLVEQNPDQVVVRYFLAKSLAENGQTEKAIDQLALCKEQGWSYRSFVEKDASFAKIKNDGQFRKTLKDMLDLPVNTRLSRNFSSKKVWARNGWPNGPEDQGRRYVLSTMLAMTGKGGSTLEQALAQIESSVNADGSKPKGTFFFAKHANIRSKIRHSQFDSAAAELRSMGHKVEISDQAVPLNNNRIVGATLGSAVVNWKISKGKYVPGALCDNFTSYGARWASGQTQTTDFLNAGAAGASGTVYEPYTIPPKFPDARLHVHYARGCTLAESFYQSVDCPFQLLIMGDPLCRPFGEFPKFEIEGLETRSVVKNDIELNLVSQPGGPEISHFELFLDGRYLVSANEAQEIRIETNDMSDGYHELRVSAVSRSLTATRSSENLEFFLRQSGESVKLNVEKEQVPLGERLVITATSTPEREIEVRQNSRVLGKIKPGGKLELDSSVLGRGKSKLRGFLVVDEKTVASVPVEIICLARSKSELKKLATIDPSTIAAKLIGNTWAVKWVDNYDKYDIYDWKYLKLMPGTTAQIEMNNGQRSNFPYELQNNVLTITHTSSDALYRLILVGDNLECTKIVQRNGKQTKVSGTGMAVPPKQ